MTLIEIAEFIIKNYPDTTLEHNEAIEDFKKGYISEDSFLDAIMSTFSYEIVGLCGCGEPRYSLYVMRELLVNYSQVWENRKSEKELIGVDLDSNKHIYGLFQYMLYALNELEFLEHGFSVFSSRVSEKGKVMLELLNYWWAEEDEGYYKE